MFDRLNNSIFLHDGRRLGYAEFGDPAGIPLFHFHGFPGSRKEGLPLDETARRMGIRIIAADRPGMGLSTYAPGRKLIDWPDDVVELAHALGLQKFAVEGISGGGPYAVVCAWKIPGYLTSATVIAGMGPFDQPDATAGMKPGNVAAFMMAAKSPWKLTPALWLEKLLWNRKSLQKLAETAPEADREALLGSQLMQEALYVSTKESFRQGVRGVVRESLIYVKPWGFDLRKVGMKVQLWQGEDDENVPLAMGRYQASNLPNCEAHFLPHEGHYSLGINHLEEILEKVKYPQ